MHCPRATAIYAQGVGLGAAKAKEIGKFSEGYSGYVQQAQEAVSGTTEVVETRFWPYQSQTIFSTLLVHIRPANVMEVEESQYFNSLFIVWLTSLSLFCICHPSFSPIRFNTVVLGLQNYCPVLPRDLTLCGYFRLPKIY